MPYLKSRRLLSRIWRAGSGGIACRLYCTVTLRPSRCARVHVTLIVFVPLIGDEVDVICPRPKSKTCTLIWQSAGCAGHEGGGAALGEGTSWASTGSETSAQHVA